MYWILERLCVAGKCHEVLIQSYTAEFGTPQRPAAIIPQIKSEPQRHDGHRGLKFIGFPLRSSCFRGFIKAFILWNNQS